MNFSTATVLQHMVYVLHQIQTACFLREERPKLGALQRNKYSARHKTEQYILQGTFCYL